MTTQLEILERIATALERIAFAMAPESPNYRRPLAEFPTFDWSQIGASITTTDPHGPAMVEWGGYEWKRRNKADFGNDIFYTRPAGKDETGRNRYLRLITFSPPTPVKRVAADVREALAEATAAPPAPVAPAPVAPVAPPPTEGEELFSYWYQDKSKQCPDQTKRIFDKFRREMGRRPLNSAELKLWHANPWPRPAEAPAPVTPAPVAPSTPTRREVDIANELLFS